MTRTPVRPFRSRDWFAAPGRSDMAALYLERFMNYGLTPQEAKRLYDKFGPSKRELDLLMRARKNPEQFLNF